MTPPSWPQKLHVDTEAYQYELLFGSNVASSAQTETLQEQNANLQRDLQQMIQVHTIHIPEPFK